MRKAWAGRPATTQRPVITSYSIHYTKLYDVVVSNGLNVLGLQHVASNVAALLHATPALIIGWLGTFGRRATPLSGTARAGLALGLLGVLLVLDPGDGFAQGGALGWQLVILLGCAGFV